MKVLLVSFYNDEAYGVRSIHAHLIHRKIDAQMMFFKSPIYQGESQKEKIKANFKAEINTVSAKEIALLIKHIVRERYDVVAFSLVSQHFSLYKKIFAELRKIDRITVVVGGWQASLNPEDTICYTDYLCIGEGEWPLVELIEKLENLEDPLLIENIWVNAKEKPQKNPVRPLTMDLSQFPIPLYENKYSFVIENDRLEQKEPYFFNSRYGTFIGRGCPYRCTYCSNSYMAQNVYPGSWSKIRYRSIEHVQKELFYVKNRLQNVQSINFYDEVFTPPLSWITNFFEWYKKEIGLPFFCFFFPGTCSEEKAEILADAGMKGVWIGVQSGSEKIRKEIFKRHYSNELVLQQAKIFHKYNVSVRYDFIFDNPFESFDQSMESIQLMLELPQPFSLNTFSLKYFPNTEITEMARQAGLIDLSDLDDHNENDQNYYLISNTNNDTKNKFINGLAFYMSNICGETFSNTQKTHVNSLIEDFKKNGQLTKIDSLLETIEL